MPEILVGMNAHPLTEITFGGVVGLGVHAHKMFAVHQRVGLLLNFSFIHYWKFGRLKDPS